MWGVIDACSSPTFCPYNTIGRDAYELARVLQDSLFQVGVEDSAALFSFSSNRNCFQLKGFVFVHPEAGMVVVVQNFEHSTNIVARLFLVLDVRAGYNRLLCGFVFSSRVFRPMINSA